MPGKRPRMSHLTTNIRTNDDRAEQGKVVSTTARSPSEDLRGGKNKKEVADV